MAAAGDGSSSVADPGMNQRGNSDDASNPPGTEAVTELTRGWSMLVSSCDLKLTYGESIKDSSDCDTNLNYVKMKTKQNK